MLKSYLELAQQALGGVVSSDAQADLVRRFSETHGKFAHDYSACLMGVVTHGQNRVSHGVRSVANGADPNRARPEDPRQG